MWKEQLTGYLTDQRTVSHQEVLGDIGHRLYRLLRRAGKQNGSQQKTTAANEEEVENNEHKEDFVRHDRCFRRLTWEVVEWRIGSYKHSVLRIVSRHSRRLGGRE